MASGGKSAFYLRKGLRELSRHNPSRALAFIRQAVEQIPPSCEQELSKALYWLSIALLRLDQRDLAVKSLANAQKLRHQSFARKFYVRHVNQYGMIKRPTAELDDLYAFTSIQLSSYLIKRLSHRFGSEVEHSTVLKLILEAWKQLSKSEEFSSLECGEKLLLFKKIKIDFPIFGAYSTTLRFRDRQDMAYSRNSVSACSCGSGLSYTQCCGRVRSISEL